MVCVIEISLINCNNKNDANCYESHQNDLKEVQTSKRQEWKRILVLRVLKAVRSWQLLWPQHEIESLELRRCEKKSAMTPCVVPGVVNQAGSGDRADHNSRRARSKSFLIAPPTLMALHKVEGREGGGKSGESWRKKQHLSRSMLWTKKRQKAKLDDVRREPVKRVQFLRPLMAREVSSFVDRSWGQSAGMQRAPSASPVEARCTPLWRAPLKFQRRFRRLRHMLLALLRKSTSRASKFLPRRPKAARNRLTNQNVDRYRSEENAVGRQKLDQHFEVFQKTRFVVFSYFAHNKANKNGRGKLNFKKKLERAFYSRSEIFDNFWPKWRNFHPLQTYDFFPPRGQ